MKVIALMGKSGAGKDRILREVIKSNPSKFNEIISCTTRPKRDYEEEGKNYFFLTPHQFFSKIANDQMLEFTEFNGWYYGTPLDSLAEDKINIGVFNPAGIRSLLSNPNIQASGVFEIEASPKLRLMRQLTRESAPNVDEIVRRYMADNKDFDNLDFETIELKNNNMDDLWYNVARINAYFGQD